MASTTNGAYTAQDPPAASESAAGASGAPDLKARIDRYGAVLAKAFDMAEAGLSLGLTVIGAVGAAAQKRIMESRADTPGPVSAGEAAPRPPGTDPAPGDASEPAPAWGITNRLPITPGAPVAVSFSINNDSALAPRLVTLALEPFVGEHTGATLAPGLLAVAPGQAVIAPMDFEKFVLQGAITPETAPDVYHGAVRVGEDGAMHIPVRLVVEPAGGA
jgi:hypothetical protein